MGDSRRAGRVPDYSVLTSGFINTYICISDAAAAPICSPTAPRLGLILIPTHKSHHCSLSSEITRDRLAGTYSPVGRMAIIYTGAEIIACTCARCVNGDDD
jgi:hypothetical protein